MTNFKNCGLFFQVIQIVFKCTLLERENIVESKTRELLFSTKISREKGTVENFEIIIFVIKRKMWYRGVKIMAKLAARNLPKAKIDLAMDFRRCFNLLTNQKQGKCMSLSICFPGTCFVFLLCITIHHYCGFYYSFSHNFNSRVSHFSFN